MEHVPDLEHCLKLREAGWKKLTVFSAHTGLIIYETWAPQLSELGLPAPLLSELLEDMPGALIQNNGGDPVEYIAVRGRGYSLTPTLATRP